MIVSKGAKIRNGYNQVPQLTQENGIQKITFQKMSHLNALWMQLDLDAK